MVLKGWPNHDGGPSVLLTYVPVDMRTSILDYDTSLIYTDCIFQIHAIHNGPEQEFLNDKKK